MNQNERDLLNSHIHPMELRLKGVEKDVEHLDKSVDQLSNKIDTLDGKVDVNNNLVKKIWNAMVGGGVAVAVVWALIKLVIPFISISE